MNVMKKIAFVLFTFSVLVACTPMNVRDSSTYETPESPDTPRTIEIGDGTYDKYTLWGCREYSSSFGGAVLELVRIDGGIKDKSNKELAEAIYKGKEIPDKDKKKLLKSIEKLKTIMSKLQVGFILFEGRKEYKQTFYSRKGINHRWDWEDGGNYSFIIKPDGTGLYYDFTGVEKGASTKANDVFKCELEFSSID